MRRGTIRFWSAAILVLSLMLVSFCPAFAQDRSRSITASTGSAARTRVSHLPGAVAFKPGEVLVEFKLAVLAATVESALVRYQATRIGSVYGQGVEIWHVPEGQELAVVQQLSADVNVEYAQPNWVYHALSSPNDPDWTKQWAHTNMQSTAAWDITTGSASITIAVIDTGIDETHPDLANKVVPGYDFVDNDTNPHDLNGHGTHVSGIAAAVTNNGLGVAGMDWQAPIMPVRVLDETGTGYTSDIASGVSWAYLHGARVLNLSLGGYTYDQALQDAVNSAHAAGSLVVAAMGNDSTYEPMYPAACANVLAVAATTQFDFRASYSNYGSNCDISAPGGELAYYHDPAGIYSTMPTYPVYLTTQYDYSQNYDYLEGTSMATPYVSGLAALVWTIVPALVPDAVQTAIQNTAADLGAPGWDQFYGWGRIDALASLQSVLPAPQAPTLYAIDNPAGSSSYLVDWSDVTWATAYTLQEDDNDLFGSPTTRYSGSSTQYAVTDQPGGRWYYRVRASNASGAGPWSGAQSTLVKPAAPVLNPISNPGNGDAYGLSWSAPPGATGYTLQEADNPSFTNATIRYDGNVPQYKVTGQPGGTWYYRVLAYNLMGPSPWSNTQWAMVSPAALPPPSLSPISNPDLDGNYTVAWSDVEGATSYTLEESHDSFFYSPAVVYTGALTSTVVTNHSGGTWYYRVRAFGPAGSSPWSSQQQVGVTAYANLPLLVKAIRTGLPIDEGFESGLMPPAGWTMILNNLNGKTWAPLRDVGGGIPPYAGAEAAACDWDYYPSNEVLLGPQLRARSAQLQFYSFGNPYWCRDTNDNCDLVVWLVVGDWGGGDDVRVYIADPDWTGDRVWSFSSVDLTPFLPAGTAVRVAFQYYSAFADGDLVGLDAIRITGY